MWTHELVHRSSTLKQLVRLVMSQQRTPSSTLQSPHYLSTTLRNDDGTDIQWRRF